MSTLVRRLGAVVVFFWILACLPSTASALNLTWLFVHTKSSPWQSGLGFSFGYPYEVGEVAGGKMSVVPKFGYIHSWFDGGYDHVFDFGAQLRRQPNRPYLEKLPEAWYGIEATITHWRTVYDDTLVPRETYTGITVLGVAGFRVFETPRQNALHVTGGVGIHYYDGIGVNLHVGVEYQFGKGRRP